MRSVYTNRSFFPDIRFPLFQEFLAPEGATSFFLPVLTTRSGRSVVFSFMTWLVESIHPKPRPFSPILPLLTYYRCYSNNPLSSASPYHWLSILEKHMLLFDTLSDISSFAIPWFCLCIFNSRPGFRLFGDPLLLRFFPHQVLPPPLFAFSTGILS